MKRRHAEDAGGGRPRAPTPDRRDPPTGLLALQRSAGNRAVNTLVMRDATGRDPTARSVQRDFSATESLKEVGQLPAPVQQAVDTWLTSQRSRIRREIAAGMTSLPEVVDQVRRSVPVAADANTFAIEQRVHVILGNVPAARGPAPAAQEAQLAAQIANLFAKVPTKVEVTIGAGQLTVGITGAEFALPGVVKVSATPGGAEAEAQAGQVKLKGEGSWSEKSGGFGFRTSAGPVKFGGKVSAEEGGKWRWSGGLSFPIAGSAPSKLPDVTAAVGKAHDAIAGAARHVASGGSATDPEVTGALKQIKPALGALGKVAEHDEKTGVSIGVTGSGSRDGGWTVGVGVVVTF